MTDTEAFRVTYATLAADSDELHRMFEQGIHIAEGWLEGTHSSIVNGSLTTGGGAEFVVRSPCDRDVVIGRFASATDVELESAVAAAAAGAPHWAGTDWRERAAVLRRVASLISERRNELAALVGYEVGKNRLEALGEVEEAADLIRYYCTALEAEGGFRYEMLRLSEDEATSSELRPYGVWGVLAPFNYPIALSAGPVSAALLAGNTAILKPSPLAPLIGLKLGELCLEAGLPPDVFHVLVGAGAELGEALCQHQAVAGITFTGSHATGMAIYRSRAGSYARPTICEMGGKNAAIVMASASLEDAAQGVARSAFGLSGQKCSACSRVYVERAVYESFADLLAQETARLDVGHPLERNVFAGPVISERSVERYERAVEVARSTGRILAGGERLEDGALARGHYVELTVADVPLAEDLWSEELFVPFLAMTPVDSLDEAIERANGTSFGLTAGFYSGERAEIDRFLGEIEAGVVYVNRKAGATTGAWPGVQPFGGWKGSGTSGKAGGGPHYLQLYAREQSRTIVGT